MQPPAVNPKAQRIIRWRETLATMNDERFFEIMRVYLGEIKSPFNKDNLIERLSSIFRKDQTKEKIINYLSEFDIKIITALSYINNVTEEKLIDFFKSEYSLSDLYFQLMNLTERLIIYSYRDSETQKTFIALNPLLEETFAPIENIKLLLADPIIAEHCFDTPFSLTPNFIAALISYIHENPGLCKNDSSIKKRDLERFETIFPGHANSIALLLKSLLNLGLVKLGEKDLSIDEVKFSAFAQLDEIKQLAFLSVASAVRLGRHGLQTQAQLLLDTIASIPESGFSKTAVLRSSFIISNKKEDATDTPVQSRFSRMIDSHRNPGFTEDFNGNIMDVILDGALEFGLVNTKGKTEQQENILVPGLVFQNQHHQIEKKGILNINAGTSIAILPGLSLKELMPLCLFLNIVSCNTVAEYDITRHSICRAFDRNISTENIFNLLSQYNAYPIPQNLEMNIEEWHKSYSSAVLYKGFVLKVDEKSERIVENNPNVKPFINLKLAPGVFLLNIPFDQEPDEFIQKSGIELMGSIKTPKQDADSAGFPLIKNGQNFYAGKNFTDFDFVTFENNRQKAAALKDELRKKLQESDFSEQQKEYLSTRIERNIIITEEQLSPETVRMEILEADAMNYAGKCHLIENAIKNQELLEIVIPNEEDQSKMDIFLAKPILITKQANDSILKVQMHNSEETHIFSVSRINHLKIIRTSVFTH